MRMLLDEGDPAKVDALEQAVLRNQVTEDVLFATGRGVAPWMASVTFGGAGSADRLHRIAEGNTIPYFRAPVRDADGPLERSGMRAVCLAFALIGIASAQNLPEGDGKAVTEKMCAKCHGLENVVRARMTRERWGAVVDDMVSRGATGSDAEIDQVIEYLASNFPSKVNLNSAPAKQMVSALGLSQADAEAIVQYRGANGKFRSIEDAAKVPGIDGKKLEAVKQLLEF